MRKTKRRNLQLESLELKTLLSGGAAHGAAQAHAHAAQAAHVRELQLAARPHSRVRTHQTTGSGTTTGTGLTGFNFGLINIPSAAATTTTAAGSALAVGDVQAIQQTLSGLETQQFIAQTLALESTQPGVQQLAANLLASDFNTISQVGNLAGNQVVLLPTGIQGADQTLAKQVLAQVNNATAINTTGVSALVTLAQQMITRDQALAASTNASVMQLGQSLLTTDQATLTAAQALQTTLSAGGTTTASGPTTTLTASSVSGIGTLSASDQAALQAFFSPVALQHYLSEVAILESPTSLVRVYATDVAANDEDLLLQAGKILPTTVTTTPAGGTAPAGLNVGIQGNDVATAKAVLQTIGTSSFDSAYLTAVFQTDQAALTQVESLAGSTTDANLRAAEQRLIPTLTVQMLAAQDIAALNTSLGGLGLGSGVGTGGLLGQVTNVHEFFRHPGNGTLLYNITFDSGGFRFVNHYTLNIIDLHNGQTGGITGIQAVQVFIQGLMNQLANDQFNTGGTGTTTTGTTTTTTGTGTTTTA